MPPLTVPAPELVLDPPSGPAQLEKPVTIRLATVRYPDSQSVGRDDVRKLGALVYRGAIGSEEVWDEGQQRWTGVPADEAALAALEPLPLAPPEGDGPWSGTLIAVGQKDGAGAPRYAKAQGGVPVYRLRVLAEAVRGGVAHRGLGTPSPDLLFVSGTEQQRFAVEFDTEDAATAGRARLLLKNGALQPAGYLEIRAAGGQEVEVVNCTPSGAALARITLSADGDIHLIPAAGREIVLHGPLEAQRIAYQPQAGGARQTL